MSFAEVRLADNNQADRILKFQRGYLKEASLAGKVNGKAAAAPFPVTCRVCCRRGFFA